MRFLTTSEVARRAGVVPDTVRAWERTGRLRALRTGSGVRLFREGAVRRYLEARAGRAPARAKAPREAQEADRA